MHWRRKWQPTPVLLPGESQGQRNRWAAVYEVAQSRTWLKWLSSSIIIKNLLSNYRAPGTVLRIWDKWAKQKPQSLVAPDITAAGGRHKYGRWKGELPGLGLRSSGAFSIKQGGQGLTMQVSKKRVCQEGPPPRAKALGWGAYQVCSRNSREVWMTTTEPTREMTNEMRSE